MLYALAPCIAIACAALPKAAPPVPEQPPPMPSSMEERPDAAVANAAGASAADAAAAVDSSSAIAEQQKASLEALVGLVARGGVLWERDTPAQSPRTCSRVDVRAVRKKETLLTRMDVDARGVRTERRETYWFDFSKRWALLQWHQERDAPAVSDGGFSGLGLRGGGGDGLTHMLSFGDAAFAMDERLFFFSEPSCRDSLVRAK